ncbi:uncharacterized protein LOC133819655 isoform X2 [Humulus lupulus]|uniref:uncharacterized protein LOC133819655 isoform X2 n=1 Tax=Humulus lupulus TaxID=3486 RepID=UPI002B410D3A|nr:uncharacterized protein LOC133819655 isoform X2 [Humulus lupulus]
MSKETQNLIHKLNLDGPYLGVVIPNLFEQNPLLNSADYTATDVIIDISGRRFRFGSIGDQKVISVMTGLGMINAGITTQLLLSFFKVEGVVHYGIAGNANPSLNIGDVAIPSRSKGLGDECEDMIEKLVRRSNDRVPTNRLDLWRMTALG